MNLDPKMIEAFDAASAHFRDLLRRAMSQGQTIEPLDDDDEPYRAKPFLRSGAARKIMSEHDLREKVLGFVVHRDGGPGQDDRDCETIRGSPGLCAILLSILTLGTPEMIPSFEARFLGERPCGKTDDDLPFDEHFARQLFGPEGGPVFFKKQFASVAVTLGRGLFHREYQALRCLPYLENEHIGSGAYGKVYRVKIEKGHFLFREPRSRNKDPVFLARKDFAPDAVSFKAFEDEDRTLRELVNSSNCPSNIMTSICSIVCTIPGTDRRLASIFFPPAICDLNKYIKDDNNRPSSHTGRLRHVRQMLGVCQALEWLARNLTYKRDSDQYIHKTYHHCDLKPDNILVCEDHSAGDDGAIMFKIGDFGQARELQHVLQREGSRRMQHPGVALAGREGTYRAPEIQGDKAWQEVKPHSDVWSFGCIFLLIIIFNYQGADAIEHFSVARRRELGDSDRFCNPNARRGDICNPAVTRHLETHINGRTGGLEIDDTITLESLKYLQKSILVRSTGRHDIAKVSENLHSIYNQRTPTAADVTPHPNVPSDATHCGHSPDGTIFFPSPTKVVLYDDMTGPREILPLATESRWSSRLRPRSTSCSRLSLCIVSEGPSDFNCVLHNTKSTVQNSLPVQLRDIRTPVDKVAVSPDGSMLAVACGPNQNHQARIRLYQLDAIGRPDFTSHRRAPSTSGSSSVTNTTTTSDPPDSFERSIGSLESVEFMVDLCFSGDSNTLYYACRLMTTSRTPRVRVTMWNTETCSLIDKCTIKDTDTTHQFPFLTSIVPFNNRVGFLCITHQRSIEKHTLHENRMHEEVFKIPAARYLRTVIVSSDDEKVVVLATPDGSVVEIYGALVSDIANAKKLAMSTKIRYDPKHDTAFIRESGSDMRICLTSLRDKKTYSFDLGRLFDL